MNNRPDTMLDAGRHTLTSSQLRELEVYGNRLNRLGVNFAVCNTSGEFILLCETERFKSNKELLSGFARQALDQNSMKSSPEHNWSPVQRFDHSGIVFAAVLESIRNGNNHREAAATVLIDMGNIPPPLAPDASCNVEDVSPARMKSEYFKEMLGLLIGKFQAEAKAEEQIEKVSTELAQTYEELVLLHRLSTNMKVTEADSNYLQMACDSLTEIVFVEGIAILLEKIVDDERHWVIAAGSGLIDMDDRSAAVLHSRLTDEINSGKEALLDSEVDSAFKYDWQGRINNIIAVPLFSKDKTESQITGRTKNTNSAMGFMVAINRIGKQDFDSTDVKLFNSVAGGCAVFIENGRLFKDLKELFIGSLKALTSSIDAKDTYTHGHSERVAYISRWIAERLSRQEPLDEEQMHKVYLAGLLHDIGKIGIEEAVLRKNDKLTEQEFERIKKHPSIGAGILREIQQMREIVPGVLCHHERVDGRGYPNHLVGEEIPLLGKIVGLADSFDAMTSKRTYRDALTVEQALAEIEKGLGTQFDEKIGRVFLDSDVSELWDIIRDGFGEFNGSSTSEEYGTAAVGTLIR
jgi:HD-GYP domain-containing protein (c-di-GMP phosphodiesterase class II)